MRLRFLCSNHRDWLKSDAEAAHGSWLRSYNQALNFLDSQESVKAVNYAGSALEAAEMLIFDHRRKTDSDIHRFTDSAVLLCHSLIDAGQPRLVCGVIGGSIARLEELLFDGTERNTVLGACQRLLTVSDDSRQPGTAGHTRAPGLQFSAAAKWSLH